MGCLDLWFERCVPVPAEINKVQGSVQEESFIHSEKGAKKGGKKSSDRLFLTGCTLDSDGTASLHPLRDWTAMSVWSNSVPGIYERLDLGNTLST
ncbi:hypothetical protein TNCT_665431 [Trichonephila clavata]|uniref:Uncharacterized protein n=1 Tax=Trichonephila clavata TaxID=2740835 RepID=A0A8X6H419_TRICU|nr:hypothetical protein TNCT_665431 [Trichonephila clavata]